MAIVWRPSRRPSGRPETVVTDMRAFFGVLVFLALVATAAPSYACMFSTDCKPGSECVKPSGSLYGYCVGGMFPGNSNDRRPARNPLDITGKQGNTCMFDTQCGPGGVCVTGSGIYGACM